MTPLICDPEICSYDRIWKGQGTDRRAVVVTLCRDQRSKEDHGVSPDVGNSSCPHILSPVSQRWRQQKTV